jgi:hypothetical protein
VGIIKTIAAGSIGLSTGLALLTAPAAANAAGEPEGEKAQVVSECVLLDWRKIKPTYLDFFECDAGWYGLLGNSNAGDKLYLRSGAGTITGLVTASYNGQQLRTKTVGEYRKPWRACADPVGSAGEICTVRAS